MSDSTLYDDDILMWSEQQAAAIRRLAERRRELPNDLDIENVAEEIESVGRSELAAVKSFIRLIFEHLIKLAAEEAADAARHWHAEIYNFHASMLDRYSPSMRQRIDIDALWAEAREQQLLAYDGAQHAVVAALPMVSPVTLDGLLSERLDSRALAALLGGSKAPR